MLRLICVRVENGISHRQVSLLPDDPLFLAPCELSADDIGDDAEPEDGDLLLCCLVHAIPPCLFKDRYRKRTAHVAAKTR